MRFISNKKNKTFLLLYFCLCILTSFLGCGQNNTGIFYSLEIEKKVTDNNLPNENLTVTDLVKVEEKIYIVAGTTIFTRNIDEKEWGKFSGPSEDFNEVPTVNSLVSDGVDLWASFSTGDEHGVFKYTTSSNTWGNNLYSEDQVIKLFYENGTLYATTQKGKFLKNADLSGTVFSENGNVIDVAYNDNNADNSKEIYLLTPKELYVSDGSGNFISDTKSTNFTSEPIFKGVYGDSEGNLYLASKEALYFRAPSSETDLQFTAPTGFSESTHYKDGFTDIISINGQLLVGTRGNGYFHAKWNGSTYELTKPSGNYISIELSSAAIHSFSIIESDTNDDDIFALTFGKGLWYSQRYDPDDPEWNRE